MQPGLDLTAAGDRHKDILDHSPTIPSEVNSLRSEGDKV